VQFARIDLFQNSFFPRTLNEYNLDRTDKNLDVDSFKRNIKTKVTRPKCWYLIGNRKLSIIHARLRMKCSSLKADLHGLHIIQDRACECGHASEDAIHFFLHCALYSNKRVLLINELTNLQFKITIDNILYGDEGLSDDNNIAAVFKIHDFIADSMRFN